MIEVVWRREVPYPQPVVLSQYFDLEHLQYVHPKSFGRARIISKRGRVIVWELEWPPILSLLHLRSRFEQEYIPPWAVRANVLGGTLRGMETRVELLGTALGTLVVEVHRVPLPNLPGLRSLVRGTWRRRLDRIWDEDLPVKVCRGGWPGVPDASSPAGSDCTAEQIVEPERNQRALSSQDLNAFRS